MPITERFRGSLALLTDLYQLTMANAYFQSGHGKTESIFHLYFRRNPFGGGYAVVAGLGDALDFLENFRFDEHDLAYLSTITARDGTPMFGQQFLEHLAALRLSCDVDAMPEGTLAFPQEPLLRIQGPIIECQLLESALLNIINFQTLVATKAARVCHAADGDPVLEFGLRRAHGIDGALAASRAAYVGGCTATSNVLAGRLFGIPVRGTHAHSWVMCFDDELEAFAAYAEAMPSNCVFLVDTYDTLQGVRHAVEIGKRLRAQGQKLLGVRLDSGDLAYLSGEARRLLDAAGFDDTQIIASNDLDENIISSLKHEGAAIGYWGVGTRLVTGHDQTALGGVYKLSAVRRVDESWQYRVKLSEQAIKVTTPGCLQVRRYYNGGSANGDLIYDLEHPPTGRATMVDPLDMTRRKRLPDNGEHENLLQPVLRGGKVVATSRRTLEQCRERRQQQLSSFHGGVKRFVNAHQYPVGLELGLHKLKTQLVLDARSQHTGAPEA